MDCISYVIRSFKSLHKHSGLHYTNDLHILNTLTQILLTNTIPLTITSRINSKSSYTTLDTLLDTGALQGTSYIKASKYRE